MKPARFRYFDPVTTEDALALLNQWGEDGKLLAGGQTLGPMLNFRALTPAAIIDINGIEVLAKHQHTDAGLVIGALTRQQALEDDVALRDNQPLVAATIPFIAHRAIRNRGTVGGSLAHADPAAEWGALVLALDAELVVKKHKGADRVVAARDFFHGFLETALRSDEMLSEIKLPRWPRGAGWSVVEFSRRHGDFALAGIMCVISRDANGACFEVRMSAFGVGPSATRLQQAENELRGRRLTTTLIESAARTAAAEISPLDDNHASAGYRRHLTKVLVERSIVEATTRIADGRREPSGNAPH
jgi:aerobic carbon-monoxide dehydrogenase medium subunit